MGHRRTSDGHRWDGPVMAGSHTVPGLPFLMEMIEASLGIGQKSLLKCEGV